MALTPRLRRGVIVVATVIFVLGWVGVLPRAAAANGGFVRYNPRTATYTVSPTGSDDTANIQAAFDGCVAHGPPCTVQLTKGTFYTGMIATENFKGKFRGMGERWTSVEALPNLPSPTADPFWAGMPSSENQWPDMFIFLSGSFTVSGITFSEPYYFPGPVWDFPLLGTINGLYSIILVVGGHADAAFDHVTVQGAPGDFYGSNALDGIYYEGFFLKPGWTNPWADLYPISGTFRVTNSAVSNIDHPIPVSTLLGAHVAVLGNTLDTMEYGFVAFDAYDTEARVIGNRFTNVFNWAGVLVEQNAFIAGDSSLRLLVMANEFQATHGALGVFLLDFGDVKTLNAVVVANGIHLDETSFCGVFSLMAASFEASQNEIGGAAAFGVYVSSGPGIVSWNEIRGSAEAIVLDGTTGVLVKGNEIKDSGQWGIAVVGGSSNSVIARNEITNSGSVDLYWDQTGTGNVWKRNECQTSDPPGLCSRN